MSLQQRHSKLAEIRQRKALVLQNQQKSQDRGKSHDEVPQPKVKNEIVMNSEDFVRFDHHLT